MCIKKYAYCEICKVFRLIPRLPIYPNSIVYTVEEKLCGRSYCNRFNVIFPQHVRIPVPGDEGTCGSAMCTLSMCRIVRVYQLCPIHEQQKKDNEFEDNDDDDEERPKVIIEHILETV